MAAIVIVVSIGTMRYRSMFGTTSQTGLPFLDPEGHVKFFPPRENGAAIAEGYIPAKPSKDATGTVFYVPSAQMEKLKPFQPQEPRSTGAQQTTDPYAEFGGQPLIGHNAPSTTQLPPSNPVPIAPVVASTRKGLTTLGAQETRRHGETKPKPSSNYPIAEHSLPNGTLLRSTLPESGKGFLDINNGSKANAVFDLEDINDNFQVREVYVAPGSSVRIARIPPGEYRAFYGLGNSWDEVRCVFVQGPFEVAPLYRTFPKSLDFSETQRGGSVEYSQYRLGIHVESGNVDAKEISESLFSSISKKSHREN